MGDEQGQSGLILSERLVIFLDENHCRNPHLIHAIEEAGAICEKSLDHFAAGTEDSIWLPIIGARSWCLLTTDSSIRSKSRRNFLERQAVQQNRVCMFYFSRNNLRGVEMGRALARAIPQMKRLLQTQAPPFTASITNSGNVDLRDNFD